MKRGLRSRRLREAVEDRPNVVVLRQTVDEYCAGAQCEPEDICLKDGGLYAYSAYEGDNANTGFSGSYVGVEYSDGSCSIVGLRIDKMCSFEEMMTTLFEEF